MDPESIVLGYLASASNRRPAPWTRRNAFHLVCAEQMPAAQAASAMDRH